MASKKYSEVELDRIDIDLIRAGDKLRSARTKEQAAYQEAHRAALAALQAGFPETGVAEALGVDRMTVRKWAGKR
ncbi:MAG TPA: hypothetical protein VN039_15390 [Nitrospira sp.]|nr:hypothetical protein [Nitrospira sp.]